MKRTGPTKEKTRKLVALLEKAGRKSKSAIWIELATRVTKPRRHRPDINLWKIEKLAKVFEGKSLVVPGKVLGFGEISQKASIVALEFSSQAEAKIKKAGGEGILLEEALEKGIKPKNMVIVK